MEAWNEAWKTKEGRSHWLEPDPFIISNLSWLKKDGVTKILDLGFGIGRHAILLAKKGFDVYGIDPSTSGLDYARKWSERERVTPQFLTAEMSQLPFVNAIFDLVIAWNVIYHGTIKIIHKTVREIKRCLKIDSYLLCTLISTKHIKYGLGEEIEKDTFVIVEEKEKKYPHHYFNQAGIDHFLKGFSHRKCEDIEQFFSGCFHWYVLTRLTSKS